MTTERKVWTRDELLASAGIKPQEWPMGWFLWGPPHYKVAPVKEPQGRRYER